MESVQSENGTYEIHDKFVIARFFEGSNLGLEEAVFLKILLSEKFQHEFGYISDRVDSYSFDPTVFKGLFDDLTNCKCAAWVTHGDHKKHPSHLTPEFLTNEVENRYFNTLPEAIEWTKSIIDQSVS